MLSYLLLKVVPSLENSAVNHTVEMCKKILPTPLNVDWVSSVIPDMSDLKITKESTKLATNTVWKLLLSRFSRFLMSMTTLSQEIVYHVHSPPPPPMLNSVCIHDSSSLLIYYVTITEKACLGVVLSKTDTMEKAILGSLPIPRAIVTIEVCA